MKSENWMTLSEIYGSGVRSQEGYIGLYISVKRKCPVCGKEFYPAPMHVYRKGDNLICSWGCLCQLRRQEEEIAKEKAEKRREYRKKYMKTYNKVKWEAKKKEKQNDKN